MPAIIVTLFTLCLTVSIYLGIFWAGGSAVTSGVKAVTNNCGNTYPVETVLSGNWFCVKKDK